MFFEHFWIISLETKQGREALHFYQLRFGFSIFIFANTKIKGDKIGMFIFIRNIFIYRNCTIGQFFKTGLGNYIYDRFAGIKYFFCKIFRNKNRGFCYPKVNSAGMFTV